MLLNTKAITPLPSQQHQGQTEEAASLVFEQKPVRLVANSDGVLTKHIGQISHTEMIHFYSFGSFNMMRLIFYILEQTGPADILMCSYSISQQTIEAITRRREKGIIRDIKFVIDHRVKTMKPKPLQMLLQNFEVRFNAIHAKVSLIQNKDWNISIISSQNATDNPKIERGVIIPFRDVFEFDKQQLQYAFDHGATR